MHPTGMEIMLTGIVVRTIRFSGILISELFAAAPKETTPPQGGSAGVPISICRLVDIGEKSSVNRVRIKAIFISDGRENTILKDPGCRSINISPYENSRSQADRFSWKAFDRALKDRSDPRVKIYAVDISGTFVWRSTKQDSGLMFIERIWTFRRLQDF